MTKKPEPPKKPSTHISRSQVTHGVTDDVKIAIANAVLDSAAMEATVEVLIWELTGLSFDDGRMLVRSDAKAKFDLAKRLAAKYKVLAPTPADGKTIMWMAMNDLVEPRNKIVHGIWVMINLEIPAAASPKIPSDPDQMAADAFAIDHLQAISRHCKKIKGSLEQMISHAVATRGSRFPTRGS
jgi:hypothetical protein